MLQNWMRTYTEKEEQIIKENLLDLGARKLRDNDLF
jgi:hypothetical protein